MANIKDWEAEANQKAQEYSNKIKTDNQYLIDQLVQAKDSTLADLQNQENNAIQKLEGQRQGIYQSAEDQAKALNVERLMNLKSTQEALNRAGLGTQGIVPTQSAMINNSYGKNLTSTYNNRQNNLLNLDQQIGDTKTNYGTQRTNLQNQYANNIASMQKSIDDSALSQYNNIYKQYLALKQQEYDNEMAEKSYQLSKKSVTGGGSYPIVSGGTEPVVTNGLKEGDYFRNNYQPKYITDNSGKKISSQLKSVGTIGSVFKGYTTPPNVNTSHNIWSADGEYYIWIGTGNKTGYYVNITSNYKFAKSGKAGPIYWW